MGYTFKSLDAVTAIGPGSALVFDTARNVDVSFQVTWDGTPAGAFVNIDGSLDGINWGAISSNFSPDTDGQMLKFNETGPVLALRMNLTEINNASPITVVMSAIER